MQIACLKGEDLKNEVGLSSLTKEVELADEDFTCLYPWEELDTTKPDPQPLPKLYPLRKTDAVYDRECEEAAPTATTKQVPYSATELAHLQEKYSRHAKETETVCLEDFSDGGDSIKLLGEEAQGPWGPRVSFTMHHGRQPWSLTQRAAYWAGGLDPLERGEPISIPSPTLGNLRESMQ